MKYDFCLHSYLLNMYISMFLIFQIDRREKYLLEYDSSGHKTVVKKKKKNLHSA